MDASVLPRDGIKMEANDDVAVSLDELTFDLGGEESKQDGTAKLPKPIMPTDTFGVDFIDLSCSHSDSGRINTHQENFVSDDPIKLNINAQYDESQDTKNSTTEKYTDFDVAASTALQSSDSEDFEVDVPPLSLFPSTKNDSSEDSDFEFEVPVRSNPVLDNKDNISTPCPSANEKDIHSPEGDNKNNDLNLANLNSDIAQPQIFTPREKTLSDLLPQIEASALVKSYDTTVLKDPEEKVCTAHLGKDNEQFNPVSTKELGTSHQEEHFQVNCVSIENEEDHERNHDEDVESHRPSIVTTAEDWEGIQTVEPGFAKPGQSASAPVIESKPLVTFPEAWSQFESFDYAAVRGKVKTHIERRGFSALSHLLFGPPKLHRDLLSQRELLFCIAATPLNDENESHIRVLQTVYRCLTGSKFDCQRFGGHWEEIGFQGRDPGTDLRGTGMLSLLHILFFLQDSNTKELSRDVYKLSLHPTQNFPFCIMGINISKICLQVFREDVFNRECNKRMDVTKTMNDVYAALFLEFYKLWKKGKTIADSGFVLQDVETYGRKQAKNVFKDLEMHWKSRTQTRLFGDGSQMEPAFFSVCKEEKCDGKTTAELY